MITFSEFYDSIEPKSDKGTLHDYINGYYSTEFTDVRLGKLNIVEIGVRRGDSLNLLSKWFINSTITGIDNGSEMNNNDLEFVNKIPNTTLILDTAYSDTTIDKFEDNSIDYLIDDGPHTIETHIYFYFFSSQYICKIFPMNYIFHQRIVFRYPNLVYLLL